MKPGFAAFFALVLFAAGFAGVYAVLNKGGVQGEGKALIGGPFSLVDTSGKRVTAQDFHGKLMLVFFGYTHCPDVCPTGLQTIAEVIDKLGSSAGKVVPIFISVDPERDTPEVLAGYIKNISPRIVGLTGNATEVASAAKAYRVYFRKAGNGTKEDYAVDHSAFIYLMDGDGRYITHFPFNTTSDAMIAVIKKQIAADSASNPS